MSGNAGDKGTGVLSCRRGRISKIGTMSMSPFGNQWLDHAGICKQLFGFSEQLLADGKYYRISRGFFFVLWDFDRVWVAPPEVKKCTLGEPFLRYIVSSWVTVIKHWGTLCFAKPAEVRANNFLIHIHQSFYSYYIHDELLKEDGGNYFKTQGAGLLFHENIKPVLVFSRVIVILGMKFSRKG